MEQIRQRQEMSPSAPAVDLKANREEEMQKLEQRKQELTRMLEEQQAKQKQEQR